MEITLRSQGISDKLTKVIFSHFIQTPNFIEKQYLLIDYFLLTTVLGTEVRYQNGHGHCPKNTEDAIVYHITISQGI